jgi:uncharacterized membrane protein
VKEREGQNGNQAGERLANALGWFSIGLGVAELLAPGAVARLIGVRDHETSRNVLRAYGLREIAAGIGILAQPRPGAWMWGRVGGDLLDISTLMSASAYPDTDRTRVAAATAAVLGVTALDALCAQRLSRDEGEIEANGSDGIHVQQTITVDRSPEEVYGFWRNFENLPTFMRHLASVETIDDRRSRWRAEGPAGATASWEAELVEDQADRRIAWRSVGRPDIYNVGSVQFERASGGRGTVVRVDIQYAPRGGAIGRAIAGLFGKAPRQLIENDLRRFKQVMEVGEVVHSDASIHRRMHPAQPPGQVPETVRLTAPEPTMVPA